LTPIPSSPTTSFLSSLSASHDSTANTTSIERHECCRDHRQAWPSQLETARLGKLLPSFLLFDLVARGRPSLLILDLSTSNRPVLLRVTVCMKVWSGSHLLCARQDTSKGLDTAASSPRSAPCFFSRNLHGSVVTRKSFFGAIDIVHKLRSHLLRTPTSLSRVCGGVSPPLPRCCQKVNRSFLASSTRSGLLRKKFDFGRKGEGRTGMGSVVRFLILLLRIAKDLLLPASACSRHRELVPRSREFFFLLVLRSTSSTPVTR
jgi:hypothetical protein